MIKKPIFRRLAATASIIFYCIVWVVSIVIALPYSLTVKSLKFDTVEPWNDVHTPAMLKICDRSYPEICMEMQDTWERAYISKTTFTVTVLAIQIGSTIRRRSKVSRTINQARRMSMQSRNRGKNGALGKWCPKVRLPTSVLAVVILTTI
ncbi:unnamed protein product [Nippostrongylus brasiliensis]|uniref:G_PROTEIN_RECEP_F1_2 domain-containing protein n=1 Tax=Nippostrongylus brasiliensis TaxID=27835 RepID=A0A3P7BZI4_NIPBR|nr:unnamed protein product [Nippostrongylus brasiliensis]